MTHDSANDHNSTLNDCRPSDLAAVTALLSANGLPTADVEQHLGEFILAWSSPDLVGVVGFEHYGAIGLLRSLCVEGSHRGKGRGRALLSAIEAAASARGVSELNLLTTTAAPFFEREGFATVPRDQAPAEIRQTLEFQSLCPASATVMRKALAATHRGG